MINKYINMVYQLLQHNNTPKSHEDTLQRKHNIPFHIILISHDSVDNHCLDKHIIFEISCGVRELANISISRRNKSNIWVFVWSVWVGGCMYVCACVGLCAVGELANISIQEGINLLPERKTRTPHTAHVHAHLHHTRARTCKHPHPRVTHIEEISTFEKMKRRWIIVFFCIVVVVNVAVVVGVIIIIVAIVVVAIEYIIIIISRASYFLSMITIFLSRSFLLFTVSTCFWKS